MAKTFQQFREVNSSLFDHEKMGRADARKGKQHSPSHRQEVRGPQNYKYNRGYTHEQGKIAAEKGHGKEHNPYPKHNDIDINNENRYHHWWNDGHSSHAGK